MHYFGRWMVFEEPARGRATLTLWVSIDGSVLGPPHYERTGFWAGFNDRSVTFSITAKPWHRTGLRPFACDAFVGPPETNVPSADPNHPEHYELVTIAVAPDVKIDRSDYDMKVARELSGGSAAYLKLRIIRVMDASWLPDLGEPIDAPALMPMEQWSVLDAIADDWATDHKRESVSNTSATTPFFSSDGVLIGGELPEGFLFNAFTDYLNQLGNSLFDVVHVIRREDSLNLSCPAEGSQSNPEHSQVSFKWLVELTWDPNEPALALWQWRSPYKTGKPQSQLRLILSRNVKVVYQTFHGDVLKDRDGYILDESDHEKCIDNDPLRVELHSVEDASERHPGNWFAEDEQFGVLPPQRQFGHWAAQLSHELGITARRDPFALLSILTMPLCLIPSPAQPVAVTLATALGLGSLYCALSERAHVVRFGYDSEYQPRTLEEVEQDLHWSLAGVVLDAAGPILKAAGATATAAQTLLKRLTDLPRIITAVENAPAPLRLLLRSVKEQVLAQLIRMALQSPRQAVFAKVFAKTIHESVESGALVLLDEMRLSFVLCDESTRFRITALQTLYEEYLLEIKANFETIDSGINLVRAEGRLGLDPLSWLLKGSAKARKSKVMQTLLGSQWRQIVERHRKVVPLTEEVLILYRRFPKDTPMTYEQATNLRGMLVPTHLQKIPVQAKTFFHLEAKKLLVLLKKANRKSFASMFELDHPFERRFVNALARGKMQPSKLLHYEKEARVLLVPTKRMVARRIPGFDGYVHYEKTALLNKLIPVGTEHLYTLQEMRDAHVFAITSLGGRNSQTEMAVKLVDEAIDQIATKLKMAIEKGDPFSDAFTSKFRENIWNYFPPSEESKHALSIEEYIQKRFLIEQINDT